jgi:REP element-mobilizing transposase RayT
MNNYNPNIHHRRSIRLQGYDYAQEGLYFITLCVQNSECLFGDINEGIMTLSAMGKVVEAEWLNSVNIRRNIALHEFVVMPNHFHAIIEIVESRGKLHSPENDNKSELNLYFNNSNNNKGECNSPRQQFKSPSQTVGAIIRGFKSGVSKQLGFSVWQRNYYEHIIRDSKAYDNISNYINENPLRWELDKFNLKN